MFAILILVVLFVGFSNGEWNKFMENPSLYEGDMELSIEQMAKLYGYATTSRKSYFRHWPYGKPIPYKLDPTFEASSAKRPRLEAALRDYEKHTCLRFVKQTTEKSYLMFVPGGGCSSSVGMQYTPNFIRLANGCFSHGTLLHEIAHSLGILHEQSRPDRDQYVKIHPENMKCCASQFSKRDNRSIDSLGFPYDYASMMHYGATAFGNGKGPTIEVLQKGKYIGQRRGFSPIDIAQINKMYRCGETFTTPAPTTKPPGFCIKHATNGRYLNYGADKKLYFSAKCHTRFTSLSKLRSGSFCGDVAKNKETIVSGNECIDVYRKTKDSKYFSIQHVGTSKCIHPKGGSVRPSEGTKAILYTGCDQARLNFYIEGDETVVTPRPTATRPTVTATKSPSGGFILRHTSGMCLTVTAKILTFTKSCNTQFNLNQNGRLVSLSTNECAYADGKNSGSRIRFSGTCKESFLKTELSGLNFALKHVDTGKCIHPNGGSTNPVDGTLAITYHSCRGDRLKFKEE